jgi:hypothetical protein
MAGVIRLTLAEAMAAERAGGDGDAVSNGDDVESGELSSGE